jgi:putative thiamine transport system permease protein
MMGNRQPIHHFQAGFQLAALPLLLIFLLPLALSLALILPVFADAAAFRALLNHPQFWGAVRLTLFTGLASTTLSLICALMIIAGRLNRPPQAGAMLALPHLSLAIGLSLLIMPAGLLARVLALPFGWTSPPMWVTTQDPYGLALAAALVLKETPFLVWAFASLLNRDDLRQFFAGQSAVARSLGHGPSSVFLRIVTPQLLSRTVWPLVAVLAYSLTVVDMAIVIGPTQPPTLAQLVWIDLNDAEPAMAARGAAGVLALSGGILLLLWVVGLSVRLGRPYTRKWLSGHSGTGHAKISFLTQIWSLWTLLYSAIVILLLFQTTSGLWPFPKLLPESLTLSAWEKLLSDGGPLLTSFLLAFGTAATALVASVVWLEGMRPSRDTIMLWLSAFLLCLPSLLIGLGQYRLFLALGITGTVPAMFLAHVLPVVAYVFIMLQGPYRGFDGRWQATAAGLGQKRAAFLCQIKWPMLKAPILAAFAVGFAVSIAQYVPAQLAAAGRYSTLPIEAVTLASGGNRALVAAYGAALMVLPLVVFLMAQWLGRPRWRAR